MFTGVWMGDNIRTPEHDEKLKKPEDRLAGLKFVTTLKLGVLCSCSFLPHLEEPLGKGMPPPPPRWTPRRQDRRAHAVLGAGGENTIVDTGRNGRLDERRAERRHGEDHQVVLPLRLPIDVCLAVR